MATTNLGRVRFNMRGDYNPDADPLYSLLDLVSDGGGSFVYINDTPSNEPTSSTSHWQQIAEKGDTGDPTSSTASDIPTSTAGVSVQGALNGHASQLAESTNKITSNAQQTTVRQIPYMGSNLFLSNNPANSLDLSAYQTHIDLIAANGADTIMIAFPLLVDATMTTAAYDLTDTQINNALDYAVSKGLSVVVKVHVNANWSTGVSSFDYARTDPANPATFFAAYQTCMLHIASLCATKNVGYLGIENELWYASKVAYRSYWTGMIKALKAAYPTVKLFNSMSTYEFSGDNCFQHLLDVIGLNLYPKFTGTDPQQISVADMLKQFDSVNQYQGLTWPGLVERNRQKYGKPIWLTEVGCSKNIWGLTFTAQYTFVDGDGNPITATDENVRTRYFEFAFDRYNKLPGVTGMFLWNGSVNYAFAAYAAQQTRDVIKSHMARARVYQNYTPIQTSLVDKTLYYDDIANSQYLKYNYSPLPGFYEDAKAKKRKAFHFPADNVINVAAGTSLNINLPVGLQGGTGCIDPSKIYKVTLSVRLEGATNTTTRLRAGLNINDANNIGWSEKMMSDAMFSSYEYRDYSFYLKNDSAGDGTKVWSAGQYIRLNLSCWRNSSESAGTGYYLESIKIEEVQKRFALTDGSAVYEFAVSGDALVMAIKRDTFAEFYTAPY